MCYREKSSYTVRGNSVSSYRPSKPEHCQYFFLKKGGSWTPSKVESRCQATGAVAFSASELPSPYQCLCFSEDRSGCSPGHIQKCFKVSADSTQHQETLVLRHLLPGDHPYQGVLTSMHGVATCPAADKMFVNPYGTVVLKRNGVVTKALATEMRDGKKVEVGLNDEAIDIVLGEGYKCICFYGEDEGGEESVVCTTAGTHSEKKEQNMASYPKGRLHRGEASGQVGRVLLQLHEGQLQVPRGQPHREYGCGGEAGSGGLVTPACVLHRLEGSSHPVRR
eukprot:Sspe_Gene.3689::Locus_1229_Transcript_1_1_Confidence_1.000_Length_6310::g.3689::m.3689